MVHRSNVSKLATPNRDLALVAKMLVVIDKNIQHDRILSQKSIDECQEKLDIVANKYQNEESLGPARSLLYELQAVLLIVQGSQDDEAIFTYIQNAWQINQEVPLITHTAQGWLSGYIHKLQQKKSKQTKSKRKKWAFIAIFVALAFVLYGPVSEKLAITFADPEMLALAEAAGLSTKGKAIFLQSQPSIVDSNGLTENCGSEYSADNVEFGCIISGKIFIRDFSESLQSKELVIAAHEMLHAVYEGLSPSDKDAFSQMVSNLVPAAVLSELNERLKAYGDIDTELRNDETHSILGTEYPNLPDEIESYYQKYFTSRSATTYAHSQIEVTFRSFENQLTDLETNINNQDNQAKTYYSNHSRAANYGDPRNANYYYNLYSKKIDELNNNVDTYNNLLAQYKVLATEYNGRAFSEIAPTQPQ